jgi:hypothetical protein
MDNWKKGGGKNARESYLVSVAEKRVFRREIPEHACSWIDPFARFAIADGTWVRVFNLFMNAESTVIQVRACKEPDHTKARFRSGNKYLSLPRFSAHDTMGRELFKIEFVTQDRLVFERTDDSFGWLKWEHCPQQVVQARAPITVQVPDHDPGKDFCECVRCDPTKR